MEGYQDEEYVSDLTDRVFLIKRELELGKIKIASHLIEGFISSFEKIRLRADGKVEPSTVDGRIRAMGAAVSHFIEREETKKNYSIYDLQKAYYEILFSNFGDPYQDMVDNSLQPYQMASYLSKQQDYADHIDNVFDDFYEALKEFWDTASDIGIIHLQDGRQLKANFSGDLFPSYDENAVSIAGLYVDTITLPCPVLRVGRLHGHAQKNEFVRLLLKHVLTCMTYRNIALEEIEPAIVLILPDRRDFTEESFANLRTECEPYVLAHAQYLFDRVFESVDEFRDFSQTLADIESVIQNLKRPDRLVFDTEWGGDARSQLTRLLADKDRMTHNVFGDHAGLEVFSSCVGRMPQAYSAKRNAQELGSTPYINANTSWLYYTWLIEYESKNFDVNNKELKNMHMVHAISEGIQGGFSWLGKVPANKIIELRRNDLMDEVRSVLSRGVDKLINASSESYIETTQQVIDNVDRAFIEHQRFLNKAKQEKLRIYGLDVAPCIVNGIIAVAGALTGNYALSSISAGLGIYGMPTIKDIKSKFKTRQEKIDAYQKSVTGILFSHK
ncbi:hypothetical protein [Klebsiella quasipneumoniae]|uniref:hypothetical protein n=1 Tax=Klebsiella quasipneumoniae TaxID=1463165 RepID=UPI001F4E1212|nr:hypothetical protein [Klebsiella quasipneumoniae]